MGIMNKVSGGADLTHPQATSGWIIGASFAVIILLIVFAIGGYLYRSGKKVVTGATSKTILTGDSPMNALSGVFGDGN